MMSDSSNSICDRDGDNTEKDKQNPVSDNVVDDDIIYKFNIATIRSATHRVRYSDHKMFKAHGDSNAAGRKKKKNKIKVPLHKIARDGEHEFQLPAGLRQESLLTFDTHKYDIRQAVIDLLKSADSSLFGTIEQYDDIVIDIKSETEMHEGCNESENNTELERLRIPPLSLSRNKNRGGKVELAQQSLSDHVVLNEDFLEVFDNFIVEVVLPDLKRRILSSGYLKEDQLKNTVNVAETKDVQNESGDEDQLIPLTFYYQRPPTMRLQPGPSRAEVKPHADCEYGHQDGELNYWLPLTNHDLTQTCLWCETSPGSNDLHPLYSKYGEVNIFFGSYCKHFVPPNATKYTRVSMDFRIGLKEFGFDPEWQMLGTKNDLARRKYTL